MPPMHETRDGAVVGPDGDSPWPIGDYLAAADWIGAMSRDELAQPDTLRLRLELAEATGRVDLVTQLRGEISRPGPPQA